MDGARSTSWKNFIKVYCLLLQMNTFGPKSFDLHAWVKKCQISLSEKLLKWHFLTQFQPAVYDVVEGADRSCIKSCDYKICSIRKIEIGDLKTELNSAIDIEGTHFKLTYNSRIKNNITRYIRIKVLGDGDDKTKAY